MAKVDEHAPFRAMPIVDHFVCCGIVCFDGKFVICHYTGCYDDPFDSGDHTQSRL